MVPFLVTYLEVLPYLVLDDVAVQESRRFFLLVVVPVPLLLPLSFRKPRLSRKSSSKNCHHDKSGGYLCGQHVQSRGALHRRIQQVQPRGTA